VIQYNVWETKAIIGSTWIIHHKQKEKKEDIERQIFDWKKKK